ncbi:hypothetical protein [Nesterenkonia pannonica]|nr:hypothetical protein [Nesterenkonia pannonica]
MSAHTSLTARLDAGPVICAEGFLFELERRGYLTVASSSRRSPSSTRMR